MPGFGIDGRESNHRLSLAKVHVCGRKEMGMKRRAALAGAGLAVTGTLAGCLDRIPGMGLSTEFEETDTGIPHDEPPEVTVDGDTVVAEGTVEYGSSSCGAVELAHAVFEASQNRLDLVVVAADDSWLHLSCTDDLVYGGYRVEATVRGNLRRVAVTEHHVFGDTYSTSVDVDG